MIHPLAGPLSIFVLLKVRVPLRSYCRLRGVFFRTNTPMSGVFFAKLRERPSARAFRRGGTNGRQLGRFRRGGAHGHQLGRFRRPPEKHANGQSSLA